jgi:cytochrome P450
MMFHILETAGAIQTQWPTTDWLKERDYGLAGLYGRGADWKRLRGFLQKDLLSPMSAKEYLPVILDGAKKASAKATTVIQQEGGITPMLNFAAMDMFMNILLGSDEMMSKEDYVMFCHKGVEVLHDVPNIQRSPWENMARKIGFRTSAIKKFSHSLETADDIAQRQLKGFIKRMKEGDLKEEEKQSYFYKAMLRQPGSDVTEEEVIQMSMILMLASVDTTAGKLGWNILQLALNPHVQEELYQQVHRAAQQEGGLTPSIFEDSEIPLLKQVIRETHRCTPALPMDVIKQLGEETTVYGATLPAGSIIMFDSLTHQMNPDLVDDPMTFKPERWTPEAVEARKDTPAAVIDVSSSIQTG